MFVQWWMTSVDGNEKVCDAETKRPSLLSLLSVVRNLVDDL